MNDFVIGPIKQSSGVWSLEPGTVSLAEAASGRYPCLIYSDSRATFWMSSDGDSFEMLSRFPYPYPPDFDETKTPRNIPQHIVDIEIGETGIEYLFDVRGWNGEGVVCWMLENGLAPGQAFRVDMTVTYFKCGQYGEEWDMEHEWEIVDRQYLEPQEHLRRWDEWLNLPKT